MPGNVQIKLIEMVVCPELEMNLNKYFLFILLCKTYYFYNTIKGWYLFNRNSENDQNVIISISYLNNF